MRDSSRKQREKEQTNENYRSKVISVTDAAANCLIQSAKGVLSVPRIAIHEKGVRRSLPSRGG